jgi:hypothetical protein
LGLRFAHRVVDDVNVKGCYALRIVRSFCLTRDELSTIGEFDDNIGPISSAVNPCFDAPANGPPKYLLANFLSDWPEFRQPFYFIYTRMNGHSLREALYLFDRTLITKPSPHWALTFSRMLPWRHSHESE